MTETEEAGSVTSSSERFSKCRGLLRCLSALQPPRYPPLGKRARVQHTERDTGSRPHTTILAAYMFTTFKVGMATLAGARYDEHEGDATGYRAQPCKNNHY
jgi:hypothetical protein